MVWEKVAFNLRATLSQPQPSSRCDRAQYNVLDSTLAVDIINRKKCWSNAATTHNPKSNIKYKLGLPKRKRPKELKGQRRMPTALFLCQGSGRTGAAWHPSGQSRSQTSARKNGRREGLADKLTCVQSAQCSSNCCPVGLPLPRQDRYGSSRLPPPLFADKSHPPRHPQHHTRPAAPANISQQHDGKLQCESIFVSSGVQQHLGIPDVFSPVFMSPVIPVSNLNLRLPLPSHLSTSNHNLSVNPATPS